MEFIASMGLIRMGIMSHKVWGYDKQGNDILLAEVPYLRDDDGNSSGFSGFKAGNRFSLKPCIHIKVWHRLYFWIIYPFIRRNLKLVECELVKHYDGGLACLFVIEKIVDDFTIVVKAI